MKWIPIITNENDWIFISFIAILGIIAFIKTYHSFRFKEFLNLLTNNKYIIIFNKKERSNTLFTTLLLIVQWVAMSICIWLIFSFFNINISIYNIHSEYIIFIGIGLFILLKLAIQFFISYSLNINNFLRSYLFIRLSYSNYASFILLLFLFLIIYGMKSNIYLVCLSLLIFVFIHILGIISFVKLYKNEIRSYWYYFILYLCTFEITPYIFINYWITHQY
ncbi:DUF4271 domain-containing protein [uncultured Capnocytophaga sp.]|jgi:putative membrane protein|uniref:DUF4271 domain-containing protein n=1 Tax=uncultured Capnocytophaga sp. TaxID=159273 RepID=UPI0028897C43|nr:DUF4271 domain-containing protein [uncultured Capnocytophaga sp.]